MPERTTAPTQYHRALNRRRPKFAPNNGTLLHWSRRCRLVGRIMAHRWTHAAPKGKYRAEMGPPPITTTTFGIHAGMGGSVGGANSVVPQ